MACLLSTHKLSPFLFLALSLLLCSTSSTQLNELRPFICNLQSLRFLDLSNNQFSGPIPACLGNFSRALSVLNLGGNKFHGEIPQIFGQTSSLQTLDVSHNRLEGAIPRSLANCRNLEILNLGHNSIADSFPFWLENLPNLQVLVLRENKFHGPIGQPGNKQAFANLHIIDVSHNNFTGELPSEYFHSWKSMTATDKNGTQLNYVGSNSGYYSDSVTIMNKGREMTLVRILTIFKAVDFSRNNFHGEIPASVGNLRSIVVLNLSRNSLSGHIPVSMEGLAELESLDLSRNNLSGMIPPQLASLTFLEVTDFSENNFSGLIPRGRQFETFSNATYEGNPGLCGFPLSKMCEKDDEAESPSSPSGNDFEFLGNGFGWKAVLMGYGCGGMFGLVIGNCIMQRKEEWVGRIFGVNMPQKGRRSKKFK